MKIAICLSGHLRKFEQTFPTLHLYLLRSYDCDIFIHTWDRMGYSSQYKTDPKLDISYSYIPQVEQMFKPKQIIVEDSNFVEELKRQGNQYAPHLQNEPKHVAHMASMFYKIYAANELRKKYQRETGVQYDWVIRCRPDLIFHQPIVLPTLKEPGKIYVNKHQSSPGWINDQFAIALPEDMDLYSSFFFNMEEYFSARNEFYPEKFMDWSLKKMKLTPEMWDLHFQILR
jgi:hypothetical protein